MKILKIWTSGSGDVIYRKCLRMTHNGHRAKTDHNSLWLKTRVEISSALTVKAVTLIFISGRDSAISSAKEGKSGPVYNLSKS